MSDGLIFYLAGNLLIQFAQLSVMWLGDQLLNGITEVVKSMERQSFLDVARSCLLIALTSGITLPAHAASVTLGAASNLAIFNMGPTTFSASNSKTSFDGNAGLAAGASTNFSGGGTLPGILYKDPGATVQRNFASQFNVLGGVTETSLAQAVTDVRNASANAAGLTPTETFGGNLTGGHTFSSTAQLNIVEITGNVTVTNPSKNITLSGGADDFFIVNVLGSLSVSNGSIGIAGGLRADHVLWNVLGGDVKLTNPSSSLYGTYLDVDGKITLTPGTVYGAVMANQIQTASGPTVNGAPFVVPLPAAVWLFCSGLAGMVGIARRRRPAV